MTLKCSGKPYPKIRLLSNNYCLLLYVSMLIDKHVVNSLKAADKALLSHTSLIYVDNSF